MCVYGSHFCSSSAQLTVKPNPPPILRVALIFFILFWLCIYFLDFLFKELHRFFFKLRKTKVPKYACEKCRIFAHVYYTPTRDKQLLASIFLKRSKLYKSHLKSLEMSVTMAAAGPSHFTVITRHFFTHGFTCTPSSSFRSRGLSPLVIFLFGHHSNRQGDKHGRFLLLLGQGMVEQ